MKRILFISNISKKITSFAFSAIHASKKLNIDFYHVANWSESNPEQREQDEREYEIKIHNVNIQRSPFSLNNIKAYQQVCELIKSKNIDYIHCNTPTGGYIGRLAGRKCKVKKVIYEAHGFHFYKGAPLINRTILKWAEQIMAHWTDVIITMNQEDYEAAQKFKLRNGGKVYKVHGVGIDLNEYDGIEKYRENKRKEFGFSSKDTVFISMGDLIKRKNCNVAIEAIAKSNNPNLHYLICGKGAEKRNLEALANQLGIRKQVHFLGFRTDIKELLAASDIFLFTSLQEGLPRSLMEAMASGLPCVVSKIRGNVDLIKDGSGGFLCSPNDSNGFSMAINKIVNDDELCKKMRKFNLDKIKEYDISVVQQEISKIYSEILN